MPGELRPIRFYVEGRPRTQGSLTPRRVKLANGRTVLRATHPEGLDAWRAAIRIAIRRAFHGRPIDEPVVVLSTFLLPGRSSPRKRWPSGPNDGDLDKFLRALGDAGERILWTNDARVVGHLSWKTFAADYGLEPGVLVEAVRIRRYNPIPTMISLAKGTHDDDQC